MYVCIYMYFINTGSDSSEATLTLVWKLNAFVNKKTFLLILVTR